LLFSRCWQNWTGDRENRFPLLETLVVILIILAVASLAIPTLLRVSAESNEASTVNSLRALNVACVEYVTIYGRYPSALSDLGRAPSATSTSADLVDAALASGARAGILSPTPRTEWARAIRSRLIRSLTIVLITSTSTPTNPA